MTDSANNGDCCICEYAILDLHCSIFVSNKKQTEATVCVGHSIVNTFKMTNFVDNDGKYPIFRYGSATATVTECYFHQASNEFNSGISVSNCRFYGIGPPGNSNNNRDGSNIIQSDVCTIPQAINNTPHLNLTIVLIIKTLLNFLGQYESNLT